MDGLQMLSILLLHGRIFPLYGLQLRLYVSNSLLLLRLVATVQCRPRQGWSNVVGGVVPNPNPLAHSCLSQPNAWAKIWLLVWDNNDFEVIASNSLIFYSLNNLNHKYNY